MFYRPYYRAKKFVTRRWTRALNRIETTYQYFTPRHLRYLSQTLVLTPWIMGALAFGLLAFVPQSREVYLRIIQNGDWTRGLSGLLSLSGFCALLYFWNQNMVTRRIDGIYPDHEDIDFDRSIGSVRNFKTIISSSLPFAGLWTGLIVSDLQVRAALTHVKAVTEALGQGFDQTGELTAGLPALPPAIETSLAISVAVAVALTFILPALKRWGDRFVTVCYVLTVLLIIVPAISASDTMMAARNAGPLASTGLVLIAAAVILRLFIWTVLRLLWLVLMLPSVLLLWMPRLPFAVRRLSVILVPMVLAILAALPALVPKMLPTFLPKSPADKLISIFDNVEKTTSVSQGGKSGVAPAVAGFGEWLGKLSERHKGDAEYPVFVIAAEGGGIYAASAISLLLAKLEERCPGFTDHIFAISGVSGGSIGAALYKAAYADDPIAHPSSAGVAKPNCLKQVGPGPLSKRLLQITRDDHLSPVLAYVLPDLVRNIGDILYDRKRKNPCSQNDGYFSWLGRDEILEKSFLTSYVRSKPSQEDPSAICPRSDNETILTQHFKAAPENEKQPALILNSTWVERAYRVAFSPFSLKPLGEGTLYSMEELPETFERRRANNTIEDMPDPSLLGAAVVSARFPFIMPPWAPYTDRKNRWTFVDGGYADSSGASTALELYNALKKELEDRQEKESGSPKAKLYLLLLTDAYALDLDKISGGPLNDFVAPFVTIINMRDNSAKRSVTRAFSQVHDELITIQLDQRSFPLPLGWTISDITSDIIRFSLGEPEACKHPDNDSDWTVSTVNNNSCALNRITELFSSP